MTLPKIPRPLVWVYIFLFGFFAFTRFHDLTARPMHNDEGVNGFFTNNLIKSNEWKYDPNNYHGPTLYYFQLIPSWLFGFVQHPARFHFNDASGLNVFTVRFTIACVGLLALAGLLACEGIIGRWGALAALLLAGTSTDFLFFSRYFIHETYVVFFTFGIFLSLAFFKSSKRVLYFYSAVLSATLLFCTKETGVVHFFSFVLAYFASNLVGDFLDKQPPKAAIQHLWTDLRDTFKPAVPHFSHATVMAMVIWGLLFTSFLKNPGGLWDSFAAYLPWTKQGVESGHIKVWSYFIKELIVPYEFPLVVSAFVGVVVAFIKNEKRGLFLGFWTASMMAVYSLIPYKTPWCVINFIFPMALTAGYGFQSIIDWIVVSSHVPSKPRALTVAAAGLLLLIGFQMPAAWTINYIEWDNEQHKQAYVHTSRDVFRLLNTIEDIGKKTGEGKTMLINVVSPEYWPIPFYLKDYPSAKFWGKLEGVDPLDASLLIAFPNQHSDLKKRLHDSYSVQNFTLRSGVIMDLWINNNFIEGMQPPLTVPALSTSVSLKREVKPGLTYELFAGTTFDGVPARVSPSNTDFNFYFDADSKKPLPGPFSIRWSGFLKIPTSGVYRFSLDSDDGSQLDLDGIMIIDNGGNHALTRKSRSANLSAGYHKCELRYTDVGGFAELGFYWVPPNKTEERVPAGLFYSYPQ